MGFFGHDSDRKLLLKSGRIWSEYSWRITVDKKGKVELCYSGTEARD